MIYAIRAVGTEYIKFGKANSVGKRLKELEVASPHELHIEAVANWPDEEERRVHQYLLDSYVRGEWFTESERADEIIRLFSDRELGLERWQAICKRYEIRTAKQMKRLKTAQARDRRALKLLRSDLQIFPPQSLRPSSTTPSKDTEMALQFMQSLMTWESSTLRSTDNS